MRLDLEKIFENTFVLDLNYELTTRDRLDKSFESFFATFNRNPSKLINLMDTAVREELKKRSLEYLANTKLNEEDIKHFVQVPLEELEEMPNTAKPR